jgi:hypothetical protein
MFDSKREALIAEGLTESEADYLMSGGTKTDGLELSASPDDASTASTTEEAAPQRGARQQTDTAGRDAELRELRERNARLDERMRIFREAAEQPEAPPQQRQKPDRDSDPFAYMAWLEERVEGLHQDSERTRAQQQEQNAYVELTTAFRGDAAQYARTNPDFWESAANARDGAYHFLMKSRDAELAAAGYNPQERMQIIAADERDIVARSFHAKQRNPSAPGPAEVLYKLAEARGYQRRSGAGGAQRGTTAPLDFERVAGLSDTAYAIWKSSMSPAQRKQWDKALGAA